MDALVAKLRAAGDDTRLRLLLLLRAAELTVSEIVEIIGQSQPRVSRHLKILCDAGLLERFREGSWVFYRAADRGDGGAFGAAIDRLAAHDRRAHDTDVTRLARVREARAAHAAAFFKANAGQWNRIRALHAPEKDVEQAIVRLLAPAPMDHFLDAGTGTGRMLEVLAGHFQHGVGLDISPEMLAIARDRLMRADLTHCQVRLGDVYRPPFDGNTRFDAVLFHQVLHYMDEPQAAIAATARRLRPGGRLVVADFAPHALDFLRTDFAHRRLGFADREVQNWFRAAGLNPVTTKAITPATRGKLTVKIWLAEAGKAARTTPRNGRRRKTIGRLSGRVEPDKRPTLQKE
jgi:ubiquinone/menaquinone biosynthesis C-methylase UbiE/DNA-binding transcriptional ArsR family regulator